MVMVSLLHFFQDNDGKRRRKIKGHDYIGAVRPTGGGSLNLHEQRKNLAGDTREFGAGSVNSCTHSSRFTSPLSAVKGLEQVQQR